MNQLMLFSPDTCLSGAVLLPASKSISNRALLLTALSQSPYPVENLSECDDTAAMQNALISKAGVIDVGAAGTAMRFLTAYLAQKEGTWIITGTERMKNRPIAILANALMQLGAQIEYLEKEGYPPLKITGKKLHGGTVVLDGGVSSQYISALLMMAPTMTHEVTIIILNGAISEPYINMTIRMMQDYGVKVIRHNNQLQIVSQPYQPVPYKVESDWSAASYWYEIVALFPDEKAAIELLGLQQNSMQGDSAVAGIFEPLGVETIYTSSGILLRKKETTTHFFEYDFVNQPDLAQTVVVTCLLKNIPFQFSGLQSLKIKETDRLLALQKEMRKLGYILSVKDNCMLCWNGERTPPESDLSIDTYEDHRMAMVFAPAALIFGKIIINNPLVVSKSYPQYWSDLQHVGFLIHNMN